MVLSPQLVVRGQGGEREEETAEEGMYQDIRKAWLWTSDYGGWQLVAGAQQLRAARG